MPLIGAVIRKDGTIPIDDDFPKEHIPAVIAGLRAQGHDLYQEDGAWRIRNWIPPEATE